MLNSEKILHLFTQNKKLGIDFAILGWYTNAVKRLQSNHSLISYLNKLHQRKRKDSITFLFFFVLFVLH